MKLFKNIWQISLAVIVTYSLLGCGEESDNSVEIEKHLKQSEYYLDKGQFKAAMIEARNVIQKLPKSLEGYVAAAKIMNATGRYEQAINSLASAAENLSADGVLTLAESYRLRGKFSSSQQLLDENRAVAIDFDEYRYSLVQAYNHAGLGNFDKSVEFFKRANEQKPSEAEPYLGLAKVYAVKGNEKLFKETMALLEKDHPSNAEFLVFKGRRVFSQGDLEKAEQLMTQALANLPSTDVMTPLRAGVIGSLADILSRQKRSAEALVYSKLLSEAYPGAQEAQGQYSRALELYQKGELDEAEKILKELLETSPGFEKAGQLLGVINFVQGDFSEADQNFANNLDPELATDSLKEVFALNSLQLNRPEDVVNLLKDGVKGSENPRVWGMYGIAALYSGDEKNGVAALKKSIELNPKNQRIHLALANYYNKKSAPEPLRALGYIENANEVEPSDVYVQRAYLQQLRALNRPEDAKALSEKILKEYGKNPQSVAVVAESYMGMQNLDKSIELLKKASELDAENPSYRLALGQAYLRTEQSAKAQSIFDQVVADAPDNIRAYQGLYASTARVKGAEAAEKAVLAYASKYPSESSPYLALASVNLSQKKFNSAGNFLEQAQKINPEAAGLRELGVSIHYGKAREAIANRDFSVARDEAIEALKLEPESIVLLGFLADVEMRAENYDEAEKLIKTISDLDEAVGIHLRGDYFSYQGNKEKSLENYQLAWQKKPNALLAAKYYRAMMQNGKSERAETFLKGQWIELYPFNATARSLLGTEALAKKDYRAAKAQFEKGLQGAPNSAVLLNNLAWVLQELNDPKAEAMAERAADLAPNNAAILDTYGWILWQKGKKKEARMVLEKALELAPDNEEIASHYKKAKEG